jgi:uncharacterized protein (DUF2235 family)
VAKNIDVFSDGTGQGGGLLPDETRSNVYKLFRAARVGPETGIDPARQVAFYDPGLGSQAASLGIKLAWWRRIYSVLSQATGLGITRNIIECYAAILRVWEPGDRIYLVGFSRGAYTVRCVAGVLKLCGIPTRSGDGGPLKRDPASAEALAKEAVKDVYQFGSALKGDRLQPVRLDLARRFRERYASAAPGDLERSNAYPYFIGVWDTVAALGLNTKRTLRLGLLLAVVVALIALVGNLLRALAVPEDRFTAESYWRACLFVVLAGAAGAAVAWFRTYVKWTTKTARPWWETLHVTGWQMQFYDTALDPHVQHARHALAIDENRKDFDRVPWTVNADLAAVERKDGRIWLKQLWFAGVHSDVGGGYGETEARLSDIALRWMVDEAADLPEPMLIDRSVLSLWPAANGMQHDERKATVARWPRWFVGLLTLVWPRESLGWKPWVRHIPHDAPLHPSVLDRLALPPPGVQHYDVTKAYRPEALRGHRATGAFGPDA